MWLGKGYEIWQVADQAERIKHDFEELVRAACAEAKEVRFVLFGTDEFWKYGKAFAKFVEDMKEYVEGRKDIYPGNARTTSREDMVALPLPTGRSHSYSSAYDSVVGQVGKWFSLGIFSGLLDFQALVHAP